MKLFLEEILLLRWTGTYCTFGFKICLNFVEVEKDLWHSYKYVGHKNWSSKNRGDDMEYKTCFVVNRHSKYLSTL